MGTPLGPLCLSIHYIATWNLWDRHSTESLAETPQITVEITVMPSELPAVCSEKTAWRNSIHNLVAVSRKRSFECRKGKENGNYYRPLGPLRRRCRDVYDLAV